MCLKRYNSLCKNENISDEQLLGYYKAADKYYKYRIGEKYVFIDTPYGFICMTVDDIIDYSAYEKRNIKNMETVYDYETVYITQESECYTYHFVLKTKFGTFKNTLSNHASMMKLNNFFEEKITRAS